MDIRKLIIIMIFGTLFGNCVSQKNIISVNADEFEQKLSTPSVQLVDTRTAEEFAKGKIASATNIDVMQADFSDKAKTQLNKAQPVYVYCHSGRRSMVAAKKLVKEGFKIINLKGGIVEWAEAGKPIVK